MLGEVIGGYRIIRQLGTGGMGVVYLAQHAVIGRYAALKLLHPEFSSDPEIVARFFNEARSAALIRHPGLVDVYDFGRLSDGSAYLVMEYLTGETLSALLARAGHLPLELALALGRQIALAVGAAHQKGIVHRDLKPDNVFVVPDDEVPLGVRARVMDFGIAKLSAELQDTGVQTKTGSFIGTPVYMSPEQCRGARNVDGRSDIYSLGCILFEMTTGKRPFYGEGVGEIIGAHQYVPPPIPSSVEASVPPWLDAIILRALAKRQEDRFQTMEELAAALGARVRASSAEAAQLRTAVVHPISTVRRGAGEISRPASLPLPRKRRKWIGVVAAAAALGVGALAFGIRSPKTPTPTPTEARQQPPPAPEPKPEPKPEPQPPPKPEPEPKPEPKPEPQPEPKPQPQPEPQPPPKPQPKPEPKPEPQPPPKPQPQPEPQPPPKPDPVPKPQPQPKPAPKPELPPEPKPNPPTDSKAQPASAAKVVLLSSDPPGADIFLGAGAAAIATGAVFYFVVGKSPPVEMAIVPTAGGAGLVVWGSF